MTRTPHPGHLEHVRHVEVGADRLRAVLATCDPTARVPSCPGWTATDLLAHHARVVHLWATFVERRPVGPEELDEPDIPRRHGELLTFHREHTARLVDALAVASPEEAAWTWSADRTVGFIARRQAHEALIHRVDAEQTAGAPTPLDPALADDGVHEVLDVMYGAVPAGGVFTGIGRHVRFELTDTGRSIWVETGHVTGTDLDRVAITVVPARPGHPDVVVRATAAATDTWLWHRGDESAITVSGDPDVAAHLRERLALPF